MTQMDSEVAWKLAELSGLWPVAWCPSGDQSLVVHPRAPILGPALCNIFVNDLADGTEDTLDKYAGDTEIGGMIDRADGCGTSRG